MSEGRESDEEEGCHRLLLAGGVAADSGEDGADPGTPRKVTARAVGTRVAHFF